MYTVGEKVVHPMHGAGVISEITEERMSGKLERYYVFSAPLSGLTLKIPVANSGAVGLRRLISRQQLAVVFRRRSLGDDFLHHPYLALGLILLSDDISLLPQVVVCLSRYLHRSKEGYQK